MARNRQLLHTHQHEHHSFTKQYIISFSEQQKNGISICRVKKTKKELEENIYITIRKYNLQLTTPKIRSCCSRRNVQQFGNRVHTINTLDIQATKRNDLTKISCLSKQRNILLGQEIDILQIKKLYKSAPSS